MADPVLHLLAGPNGSGKTTLWAHVLEPVLRLEFINADDIAEKRWPKDPVGHAYEAADLAAAHRRERIAAGTSFATETVFSHGSKVELVRSATAAGYLVTLRVVVVPVQLAVARVEDRVQNGGHFVPEAKVRERHERLWSHVAEAITICESALVYDSTTGGSFRLVAEFERGALLWADWPMWVSEELTTLQ